MAEADFHGFIMWKPEINPAQQSLAIAKMHYSTSQNCKLRITEDEKVTAHTVHM